MDAFSDTLTPWRSAGGGSGFTVICGVAAPVKAPRMGQVRPN